MSLKYEIFHLFEHLVLWWRTTKRTVVQSQAEKNGNLKKIKY